VKSLTVSRRGWWRKEEGKGERVGGEEQDLAFGAGWGGQAHHCTDDVEAPSTHSIYETHNARPNMTDATTNHEALTIKIAYFVYSYAFLRRQCISVLAAWTVSLLIQVYRRLDVA